MKTYRSKIIQIAAATALLLCSIVSLTQASAQAQTAERAQTLRAQTLRAQAGPAQTEPAQAEAKEQMEADDSDDEAAATPLVCLGMGMAEDDPDRFWLSQWRKESALFETQEGWKSIEMVNEQASQDRLLLDRLDPALEKLIAREQGDRDEEQAALMPGLDTGTVCDLLSLGILTSPLIGSSTSTSVESPEQSPPSDRPRRPAQRPTVISQDRDRQPPSKPPQPPTNPTPTPEPEPIPTPALLPSLVGLGIATIRKRKSQ